MKKTLYGTTAIVALGLAVVAAAPASAQAPAQGFSSTNFAVTIGGFARQYVSHTNTDNTAATVRQGVKQVFDNRLQLNFRAALPNGMTAGSRWEINPQANTATGNSITRRSFVFLESSFGLLQLGNTEHVANQAHVVSYEAFTPGLIQNGPTALTATRSDGTASVFGAGGTGTGADIDGISSKINYFTPRIEGFQAGVSYIPEMAYRNGLNAAGAAYENGRAAMVNYVNTLGGVALRASLGYQAYDAPSGVNMSTAQQASRKNPSLWNAGLGVRYMGFDVGGSYAKLNGFRNYNQSTVTVAAALPTTLLSLDGHIWEAGIGYVFGPAGVSVNYLASQNDNSTFNATTGAEVPNANGKDSHRIIGIGGHYTMGPGVQAVAGYFNSRAKDNANGNFNGSNSATSSVFITGLALTF